MIFDCDGTLVDSELLSNVALSSALLEIGVDETGERLLQRYRGGRMALMLADLEARHGLTLPEGFEADYRARVAALFERELRAVDGVKAVVEALTVLYCVASSGPRHKIELSLRVTGLWELFEGRIFSAYEVGSWKPEPDLFLHAAAQLGRAAAHCAVVEDSLLGAQAAASAGMRCCLYDPDGALPGGDVFGAQLFRSMTELPALLSR